jgi:hypothetical protein
MLMTLRQSLKHLLITAAISILQSGKKTKPGAFAITTIWNFDTQTEEIRAVTGATATEMSKNGWFYRCAFL